MSSHATFFNEPSNALYTTQKVYGGPLGNYLTHKQTAIICGVASLPFTTKIGLIIGGALGFGAGIVLTEITSDGDAADKAIDGVINMFGLGTAGAALGFTAGIPASYKLHQFLFKKMVQHADKQIVNYTSTLTKAGRSNLLNHIKSTNSEFRVKSDIFQSNEQSFRNFMNILDSNVETE
jgi:hypothetical protein